MPSAWAIYLPIQHSNTNASQVQNFNGAEEFKEMMFQMQAKHDESVEKITALFLQAIKRLSERKK